MLKKYSKLFIPFFIGLAVFLLPTPDGLSNSAWIYISIFVGVVAGLILEPIPPAFIGLIGVTLAMLFKVGPINSGDPAFIINAGEAVDWALSGFSNATVWLIFAAFMIGLGYSASGLGNRIAILLVRSLGRSTLGLGYAIAITDGMLAPFIPSNAARSGGTLYPIVSSIPPMFGSYPDKGARKIGAYLTWCALASTCVSSSIFLTGQAPNPLALEVAAKAGVSTVDWMGWYIAFLPVGIILFLATPLLTYVIYPPEIKKSPEVVRWAQEEYVKIGKISGKEIYMLLISILALILWIGSSALSISATTTAVLVIILMISTRIITWNDFTANKTAWNVLTWFATLVTLAGGLKNVGFLNWTAEMTQGYLQNFSPFWAMIILVLVYYFLHYFFASGTAHVTALLGLFIVIAQSVPGMDVKLAVLIMLLPMGLMGVLTPYGSGHSPVWFASGYVKGPDFWRLGAIFGILYVLVYLFVGLPWITNFAYGLIF